MCRTVCWRSALTSAAEGQPLGTAVLELCTVVWWCLGLDLAATADAPSAPTESARPRARAVASSHLRTADDPNSDEACIASTPLSPNGSAGLYVPADPCLMRKAAPAEVPRGQVALAQLHPTAAGSRKANAPSTHFRTWWAELGLRPDAVTAGPDRPQKLTGILTI